MFYGIYDENLFSVLDSFVGKKPNNYNWELDGWYTTKDFPRKESDKFVDCLETVNNGKITNLYANYTQEVNVLRDNVKVINMNLSLEEIFPYGFTLEE